MRLAAAPDTIKALAKRALFLWPEIETTVRKQDQHQPPGGRGSGSKTPPPPANLTAMQAAHDLHMALLRMARHVDDWTGQPYQYRDAPEAARDVRRYCDVVAEHASREDVDTADRALRVLERMIDRTVTLALGECECGDPLTAGEHDEEAECKRCGLIWEVDERQAHRRNRVLGAIKTPQTATAASRILEQCGVRIPAGTIRRWASEGKLLADGEGTYSLTDILDVAGGVKVGRPKQLQ